MRHDRSRCHLVLIVMLYINGGSGIGVIRFIIP